jgi:hypothetical protein
MAVLLAFLSLKRTSLVSGRENITVCGPGRAFKSSLPFVLGA